MAPEGHKERPVHARAKPADHLRRVCDKGSHGDTAVAYKGELETVARFVHDYPEGETGGDLFGFWTNTGAPVIQYVLGPGNASRHEKTAFYQESAFLRSAGAILHDYHGLQHIGTWHSHHRLELREPSRGDSATMQNTVDRNGFKRWLLVICNFAPTGELVEMRAFLYRRHGSGRYVPLTWVLLPGVSPLQTAVAAIKDFVGTAPQTAQASFDAIPHTTFSAMTEPAPVPSIQFPQSSFLATTDGRSELYQLYQELSAKEHNVEILQRSDGRVALAFEREGYAFEIVFPHAYPVVKPVVEYHPVHVPAEQHGTWTRPRTLFVAMDRGDDTVSLVEDLVDRFLTSRQSTKS